MGEEEEGRETNVMWIFLQHKANIPLSFPLVFKTLRQALKIAKKKKEEAKTCADLVSSRLRTTVLLFWNGDLLCPLTNSFSPLLPSKPAQSRAPSVLVLGSDTQYCLQHPTLSYSFLSPHSTHSKTHILFNLESQDCLQRWLTFIAYKI